MDIDGGGFLEIEEIHNALARLGLGLQPAAIQAFVELIDTDKSGVIDKDEFVAAIEGVSSAKTSGSRRIGRQRHNRLQKSGNRRRKLTVGAASAVKNTLRLINSTLKAGRRSLYGIRIRSPYDLFHAIDVDNDGYLEHKELHRALQRLGLGLRHEDVSDFIATIDIDEGEGADSRISLQELLHALGGHWESPQNQQATKNSGSDMSSHANSAMRRNMKHVTPTMSRNTSHTQQIRADSSGTRGRRRAEQTVRMREVSSPRLLQSARARRRRETKARMRALAKNRHENLRLKIEEYANAGVEHESEILEGKLNIDDATASTLKNALIVLRNYIGQGRSLYGQRLRGIRHFFSLIDTDKDGLISCTDLEIAMNRLDMGINVAVVEQLVECFDVDSDGKICLEEMEWALANAEHFVAEESEEAHPVMVKLFNHIQEKMIKVTGVFRQFAGDDDELTREELKMGITKIAGKIFSEDEIETVCELVDSDGSGDVSLEEFVEALRYANPNRTRRSKVLSASSHGSVQSMDGGRGIARKSPKSAGEPARRLFQSQRFLADKNYLREMRIAQSVSPAAKKYSRQWRKDVRMPNDERSISQSQADLQARENRLIQSLPPGSLRAMQNVCHAVAQAVSHNRSLYGQRLRSYRHLFNVIDIDSDGHLDKNEVKHALRRLGLGLQDRDIETFCMTIDEDDNQRIDYHEFERSLARHETYRQLPSSHFAGQP